MTNNTSSTAKRGGFTLLELVISILIYGIVLAAGIGFVATQNTLFHKGLDRMTSLQNLRYAIGIMEVDIPTLGTNVPATQPTLVYADTTVLAFSADYASNVANDYSAVYINIGAPAGEVSVPTSAMTIPNSSFTWPDTLYTTTGGSRSPAELLVFWMEPDTLTSRTDDWVLWRQINNKAPEPLTRNLLPPTTGTFFRFFKRTDYASQAATIDSIPEVALPVRHSARFHATPSDTGASARADSIRAVRVSFRSTNGLAGDNERIVEASRLIDMPNAGFGQTQTCGDEPIFGQTFTAALQNIVGGGYQAALSWNAATDETSGETDVVRYVIYRQSTPIGADWGDPFLSIPAGNASYTYQDQTVELSTTYQYAIAAQDCTPTLSTLTTSGLIAVPAS